MSSTPAVRVAQPGPILAGPSFRTLTPVFILVSLLLTSCDSGLGRLVGPSGPPSWYGQPPYTPGMLHAVGAAADRDSALQRARAALVSQLRLTIRTETSQVEEYASSEATGTNRAERLAQKARNQVQAQAQAADLPGVTVVEQTEAQGTMYVLLRLDREAWAAELRSRIAEIDARLPGEVAAVLALPIGSARERLTATGTHIRRLLPILVERDEFLTRLRIATPGTAMPAETIDRAALDRRLSELLADLTVVLPADPSVAPLHGQLIESLRLVGLRTIEPGHPGVLELPLVLTLRSETIQGQIRLDGQLSGSLRLAAEAGGTQLGGISLAERASSANEAVARERLYQKLSKRLAEDLDQRLTRMLAGN